MRFVDEINIHACSGDGGDGVVRFSAPKKHGGKPSGGDGGKGGDIVFEAIDDILILRNYISKKEFKAGQGKPGGNNYKKGQNGADVVIKVPVGSVIHVELTKKTYYLNKVGDRIIALKGGRGGYGNFRFKSSINRSPSSAIPGQKGLCSDIKVELRLIADVGLVGLPNAGKSSLFNKLIGKNASKSANYEFTTLQPYLGVIDNNNRKITIADIPGIIKGASTGKGLGIKFIKHILRAKTLIFCISVERDNPYSDLSMLYNELCSYNKELINKKSVIVLTKKDLIPKNKVNDLAKNIKNKTGLDVIPVSIYDENSIKYLRNRILELI